MDGPIFKWRGGDIANGRVRKRFYEDNKGVKTPTSVAQYVQKAFIRYAVAWNKSVRSVRSMNKTRNMTVDDAIRRNNQREKNSSDEARAIRYFRSVLNRFNNVTGVANMR